MPKPFLWPIKFLSVRFRFLLVFTVLFSLVFAVASDQISTWISRQTQAQIMEALANTLRAAAAGVETEAFAALAREGTQRADGYTDDARYWRHVGWLATLHGIEPRANLYTYVRGQRPGEVVFIGSSGAVETPRWGAKFLESYFSSGTGPANLITGLDYQGIDPVPYQDQWGYWLSGWAPIINAKGETVGGLGVDFRAGDIQQVQNQVKTNLAYIFLGAYLAMLTFSILVIEFTTLPLTRLLRAARQLGSGNSEQALAQLSQGRFPDEVSMLAQIIRERNQAETALRESEATLRVLFDAIPESVMLFNPESVILAANEVSAARLGLSPAALVGRCIYDFFSPAVAEVRRAFMREALHTRQPVRFDAVRAGYEFDYHIHPILDATGEVEKLVVLAIDVTARKQAEAEIRQLNTALEQRVEARTAQLQETVRLLGEAHASQQMLSRQLLEVQEQERRRLALELHDELGQILNSIKISLNLLPGQPTPQAQEQMQRIQHLIDSMIAHIRRLALDLRPSILDHLGLIPALQSLFQRQASQAGLEIDFATRLPDTTRFPAPVETTAYRIVQEALTNLSRHAGVKHARVELQADEESLRLTIADAGIGFDAETVLASPDTTGLSGMRERARLLKGELLLQSAPGAGTRLLVTLPLLDRA